MRLGVLAAVNVQDYSFLGYDAVQSGKQVINFGGIGSHMP